MNTNTTNNNTNVKEIMNEIVNNDEIMEIIIRAAKKAAKKDKFNKKGFRKELKKLNIGELHLSALNNNTITFKTGDININIASDWQNDMPIKTTLEDKSTRK